MIMQENISIPLGLVCGERGGERKGGKYGGNEGGGEERGGCSTCQKYGKKLNQNYVIKSNENKPSHTVSWSVYL